jgi:hypothetical protein
VPGILSPPSADDVPMPAQHRVRGNDELSPARRDRGTTSSRTAIRARTANVIFGREVNLPPQHCQRPRSSQNFASRPEIGSSAAWMRYSARTARRRQRLAKRPCHHARKLLFPERVAVVSDALGHNDVPTRPA